MLEVGVAEDLSTDDLMGFIQDVVGHDGPVEHEEPKSDGTPWKLGMQVACMNSA